VDIETYLMEGKDAITMVVQLVVESTIPSSILQTDNISGTNPILLYILVGYLILTLIVGLWSSMKISDSEDFILAGRSLGVIIIAGTLMATWMGSGTVTGGGTSIGYSNGLWPAILYGTAPLVGIGILRLFTSKIRSFNSYTIPAILEEGIGKEARAIGLSIVVVAYIGIIAYQFTGFGLVLAAVTNISAETGTIIAAVIIIALAVMGGLTSVAYTDTMSAFLMILGLVIALPIVISTAGGWSEIVSNVPQSHTELLGDLTTLEFLGLWLPTLFLVLADQNMYQRLIAGGSDRETYIGTIGWFIGVGVAGVIIPIIAFTAQSMFPDIAPGMALIAVTTVIPPWIGGILLAAISAFIITTGNSFLLSAATNVSEDLYCGFINSNASDQRVLWITRVTIVAFGIIAYALGRFFPTILSLQIYAYTIYGAAITPAIFAIFLMRERLTKFGGVTGMLTGFGVTIVWVAILGEPFGLDAVIPAAPAAAVVTIFGSYISNSTWKLSSTGTN
jgi:SSS family solute:Na+ symporter